ncbi:MAG TPA: ABC transporter ATP-binding protein [Microthrixaceae bacterium]|nr:ABC transporter ATP-binding protein [Microthrixaceae bacterium]
MSTAEPLPHAEGIRIAGVTKRFERRGQVVEALGGVDLDIAEGELVTLIGPSGCGKSTLLRIIGGLLGHDAGSVTIGRCTPDQARAEKHFGFVPQAPALLPWRTVLDNVTLLGELNRRNARPHQSPDPRALLAEVGLAEFANAHPSELSGGMQQRVALARAVALGSPVLLMDEPFAALDEITRSEMRYLLLEVWERTGATCLFITHSVEEAVLLSDRVAVMTPRPGRIAHVETIGLPRPRTTGVEDQPEFHAHVAAIRRTLRGSPPTSGVTPR